MTFEEQTAALREFLQQTGALVETTRLPSGAHLVEIKNYKLAKGWNLNVASLLFVAPPAYPSAQPDSFWVEPNGIRRLSDGAPPQNSNESNPIPEVGQRGTWFSWHVQGWRPNESNLITFLNAIRSRLDPAR